MPSPKMNTDNAGDSAENARNTTSIDVKVRCSVIGG
jgi:hypothetical protein